MYTSAELQLLRNADPGVQLPGIDTPAGNPLEAASLKPLSSLPSSGGPVSYNAKTNVVYITQAGATISGYNFGNATVFVCASNVTIENCSFTATTGYDAIQVNSGTNTTITNCTFDSQGIPSKVCAWITSKTPITVTNNRFIDTPADGVDVTGGGVISGNYFSGVGYSINGLHPDAIWITNSTTPMTISNNFIDWTNHPNSINSANNCIRITSELGNVANVTVTGNYLIGGSTTIDAGNAGSGTFSNIAIANNYLGFAAYGVAFYAGPMSGVTTSGNVIFDYTNPAYSTDAWAADKAAGLSTPYLLVSTAGSTINAQTQTGPTTLYGSPSAHLIGGSHENIFISGFGRQYIFGGAGANIYTYLSPANSTPFAPDWINLNFSVAKDVIDLSYIDANLTAAGVQAFTFIGTNAFTSAGAQVRYQLDPIHNMTVVQVALAGDTSPDMTIDISGQFNLSAANFALSLTQSATDVANGAALSVSTARSGSAFEYLYTNVKGRAYSSYQSVYYANNVAADDLNLSATANEIDLYERNVTLTRAGQAETLAIGNGSFKLAYHANETIQAGNANAGAETFVFSKGYGQETINGFAASGANADTLVLSTSDFSYLTGAMTQAQDLAAVLSHASSASNGGVTIGDKWGDSIALVGVSAATLTASPSAVKFV